MKSLLLLVSVACFALLLVANGTNAQPYPWDEDAGLAETVLAWMKEVEAVVRARSDPVQRAIVCRVPYTDIVITALIQATNLSRPKIMHATSRLENMGLVKVSNNSSGQWTITPESEEAREKMKRWAESWCVGDDKCDVAH